MTAFAALLIATSYRTAAEATKEVHVLLYATGATTVTHYPLYGMTTVVRSDGFGIRIIHSPVPRPN